jgi:hypothetical protein
MNSLVPGVSFPRLRSSSAGFCRNDRYTHAFIVMIAVPVERVELCLQKGGDTDGLRISSPNNIVELESKENDGILSLDLTSVKHAETQGEGHQEKVHQEDVEKDEGDSVDGEEDEEEVNEEESGESEYKNDDMEEGVNYLGSSGDEIHTLGTNTMTPDDSSHILRGTKEINKLPIRIRIKKPSPILGKDIGQKAWHPARTADQINYAEMYADLKSHARVREAIRQLLSDRDAKVREDKCRSIDDTAAAKEKDYFETHLQGSSGINTAYSPFCKRPKQAVTQERLERAAKKREDVSLQNIYFVPPPRYSSLLMETSSRCI